MNLIFTNDYLERLDKFATNCGQDKEVLLEEIQETVQNATITEIKEAQTLGVFAPARDLKLRSIQSCGLNFEISLVSLIRNMTVNWDDFWKYQRNMKDK